MLLPLVADARFRHGRFPGTISAAGLGMRQETELKATADDALASSAIEGETLPPPSQRAFIHRPATGLPGGGVSPRDSRVEGVADMVVDATRNFRAPLTRKRISSWHHSLFATGSQESTEIGKWRTDAQGRMQVVSSTYAAGKAPRVHFEAPPAALVPDAMAKFLNWFNASAPDTDGLVRAGIAHLWFLTIHPLDDGNGRIGRAIADITIARAENDGRRFYSLSSAIPRQRRSYYEILKRTQKGDLDITGWLVWFLECHRMAIKSAEATADRVIDIGRFWTTLNEAHPPINERQRKVLSRLLEGWEGLLTTRKWVAICGCSADTAQRDIGGLVGRGLLVPNEKRGRSAGYTFTMDDAFPRTE